MSLKQKKKKKKTNNQEFIEMKKIKKSDGAGPNQLPNPDRICFKKNSYN